MLEDTPSLGRKLETFGQVQVGSILRIKSIHLQDEGSWTERYRPGLAPDGYVYLTATHVTNTYDDVVSIKWDYGHGGTYDMDSEPDGLWSLWDRPPTIEEQDDIHDYLGEKHESLQ